MKYSLYYRPTCIFCTRVLHQLQELPFHVEQINISASREALAELVNKGGRQQVPALKIVDPENGETWMYESRDILQFLKSEMTSTT